MKLPKLSARTAFLVFFMLLLSLPGLNLVLPFIESGALKGAINLAPNASFKPGSWMRGTYQNQKEKYLNDNIGFRPDMVRLNNEIDLRLFRKIHANIVVEGKDHYLYEESYINAYYGKDYLGDAVIDTIMYKLRFIQDTLARAGKALVIVFVPSKGRYFPEYFPDKMLQQPTTQSNYLQMKRRSEQAGLNVIDLNGWFCNMKATTPRPLFSKQGIHWTVQAAGHAFDSMNHYLEKLLRIDIPHIAFNGVECTNTPRGKDNDVAQALNLIWPYTKETFCYDKLSINKDSAARSKADLIFLGDSFFWSLMDNNLPQQCYHNWEFWFYFNEIWDNNALAGIPPMRHTSDIDWMESINQHKALVLFYTEPNLIFYKKLFVDAAYQRFGGK